MTLIRDKVSSWDLRVGLKPDFVGRKNLSAAYWLGKDLKVCPDCGYRLCTCQMELSEFD